PLGHRRWFTARKPTLPRARHRVKRPGWTGSLPSLGEQGALNQPREVLGVLLGRPSQFASELPPGSGHGDDIDEVHHSVDRPSRGEPAFGGDALDDRPNVLLAATHPIPPGGRQGLSLVLAGVL